MGTVWALPRAQLLEHAIKQKVVYATVTPRRTLTGRREVYGVLAPSIGTDETLAAPLPCVVMGEILFRVRARVVPLFGPEDALRWYTPEE